MLNFNVVARSLFVVVVVVVVVGGGWERGRKGRKEVSSCFYLLAGWLID